MEYRLGRVLEDNGVFGGFEARLEKIVIEII